ncbi:MAG: MFS transporter [Alphaproteobacteria bacterium]|nr:MFS transporter [Alphaproteobacteria bacterium]
MADQTLNTGVSATHPPFSRVIALIGTAHFLSHFYMVVLPVLFPVLAPALGVSFTQLGLAMTAFSIGSGLFQAPVGFAVDRYGAKAILIAGVALEGLAFLLIGVTGNYIFLLVLMTLAGIANSVYHPADYAILNASVDQTRIGRAFSIHTFTGFFGGAVAPAIVLGLQAQIGWQSALTLVGLSGLVMAALLLFYGRSLTDVGARKKKGEAGGSTRDGISLLFSKPVLSGLFLFVCIALVGGGINGFGTVAMVNGLEMSLEMAGLGLTGFLSGMAGGVLIGGLIADRTSRHDLVAILCFALLAATMAAIAATSPGPWLLIPLLTLGGMSVGIVAPSRDMIIRSITPPDSMGKVFGFVSVGFNIGGIIAPPAFGLLLDHGAPTHLFWAVSALALLTVLAVMVTTWQRARHQAV